MQQPLPPPGQNAAPLYARLTKLLHDKPLNLPIYAEGMYAFHAYTPAQIAAVRRTLAARQDVMTLIHQAADKPHCVFVRDWSQGTKLEFPEYQPMRQAVRLIETESYLLARGGHYREAVANQARGYRVAEHTASDRLLLAYIEGVSGQSLTLIGMQSIMQLAGPNAAVEADVQQALAAHAAPLSLRDAMAGEAGLDCTMFPAMHQVEKDGLDAVLVAGGVSDGKANKVPSSTGQTHHLHGLIDAWEADYLARMRALVLASDLPPLGRRAAYDSLEKQMEQDADTPGGTVHLLSDTILPIFSGIDEDDTRIRAREAVTLAGAALLADKAKTGAFPAQLPPGFTDPFTGKPLLYRREGSGFVVYSAGPTGRFDGGKPGVKAPGRESVFRYPAVPVLPT